MPVIEPLLEISKGNKRGHSLIYKFGVNGDINGNYETIWPLGGIYPTIGGSAVQLTISSSSGDDNSTGIGARSLTIQGLDVDYNQISETVDLDGTNSINTSREYIAVNRAFVETGGTSEQVGNISVLSGSANLAYIDSSYRQTMQSHYTIPANHTGYLIQVNCSSTKNDYIQFILYQKTFGGVYRSVLSDTAIENSTTDFTHFAPQFSEKTEIDLRAIGVDGSSNNNVSGEFTLVLVDNNNRVSNY